MSQDEEETIDVSVLREMSDEAVIALSKAIILRAVQEKASDIHISPTRAHGRAPARRRRSARGDDGAQGSGGAGLAHQDHGGAGYREPAGAQDGRIGLNVLGRPYDFRVSTLPGVLGEKIVMRILDKGSTQVGLRLGFSTETRRFSR